MLKAWTQHAKIARAHLGCAPSVAVGPSIVRRAGAQRHKDAMGLARGRDDPDRNVPALADEPIDHDF
ncbi:hypothetical protein [Caulobacter sp. NIBR2454]|uniref:hypothetical protein n=1 Tax=Caulobacter sp. NIBR2454 TaxID=3015996 RepID=UPI0022B6C37E|nr:hypothetical protein [Caulobacter sp. NIBR2454]